MKKYIELQIHYENCLAKYGPNSKGMDWPNSDDLIKRFKVLTSIINEDLSNNFSVLDLGCGVGLMVDFLKESNLINKINYKGIDISSQMISFAKKRFPEYDFEGRDILESKLEENSYDYIIMNGLFTEKLNMSQSEMLAFFKEMIKNVFDSCKKGFSFNVMSAHVDWKRDDLFHLELDQLVSFLVQDCSRNIKIDMDYGLFEYSVFVRK
jgi:SAM-dependent methyltransferase